MDPTVMRLIWVVLTFATGIPVLAYPICWMVMSRNDNQLIAANYQRV
jgi:phage shock protein PspC (stress-responsive transcriptional regulator)